MRVLEMSRWEEHEMNRIDVPTYIVDTALKQGATDVAAELREQDQKMIRFSNNEITVSKSYREAVISIFVMVKNHRTVTKTPLSSMPNLRKAAMNLVNKAKKMPPADVYAPLPKGPFQYNPKLLASTKASFSPDKLVGHVDDAISGALKEGAIKVAGTLIATKVKTALVTSGQVHARHEKSGLELSVRAFCSDIASGHAVSICNDEEQLKPNETGRTAGKTAKAALNPVQGMPGKFTALLGPLVFADLVSQVGIRSSAYEVEIGRSFLADKIGQQVACSQFSLVDDPTDVNSFGMKAFDDEGVPTRRNIIIEKGILKTYLHNSLTAKKHGVETTGNAGLLHPNPWNLVVEPGGRSFEHLIAGIDDGIYVTNDWYLRYQNYKIGDFSTIPRDGMFQIRKGEVQASIRELRISDNMIRIMQNIRELSQSRTWIKWWEVNIPTLTPYAVVEDLNFTKSGM
jgi:PmbA protein